MDSDTQKKLHEIFFNASANKLKNLDTDTQFVHYTNSVAAMEIIRNREIWMRDPAFMNDTREISHGLDCIFRAIKKSEAGKIFLGLLRDLDQRIPDDLFKHLDGPNFNPYVENYITCLSEHPSNRNEHGLLSMWRAYGGGSGVAIVVKPLNVVDGPGILNIVTSPVMYTGTTDNDLEGELKTINSNIRNNLDYLRELDKDFILLVAINFIRIASLSIKHRAFEEEREWRLIYSPKLSKSDHMEIDVKAINGVPQRIYKIPLRSTPCGKKTGAELHDILDRVIIGPTQFEEATKNAFIKLLKDAEVPNAEEKVFLSKVPLRT